MVVNLVFDSRNYHLVDIGKNKLSLDESLAEYEEAKFNLITLEHPNISAENQQDFTYKISNIPWTYTRDKITTCRGKLTFNYNRAETDCDLSLLVDDFAGKEISDYSMFTIGDKDKLIATHQEKQRMVLVTRHLDPYALITNDLKIRFHIEKVALQHKKFTLDEISELLNRYGRDTSEASLGVVLRAANPEIMNGKRYYDSDDILKIALTGRPSNLKTLLVDALNEQYDFKQTIENIQKKNQQKIISEHIANGHITIKEFYSLGAAGKIKKLLDEMSITKEQGKIKATKILDHIYKQDSVSIAESKIASKIAERHNLKQKEKELINTRKNLSTLDLEKLCGDLFPAHAIKKIIKSAGLENNGKLLSTTRNKIIEYYSNTDIKKDLILAKKLILRLNNSSLDLRPIRDNIDLNIGLTKEEVLNRLHEEGVKINEVELREFLHQVESRQENEDERKKYLLEDIILDLSNIETPMAQDIVKAIASKYQMTHITDDLNIKVEQKTKKSNTIEDLPSGTTLTAREIHQLAQKDGIKIGLMGIRYHTDKMTAVENTSPKKYDLSHFKKYLQEGSSTDVKDELIEMVEKREVEEVPA